MKWHCIIFLILLSTSFVSLFSQAKSKSSLAYSYALEQAWMLVEHIELEQSDLQHMIEFIEFYASWYAPVTPAPYVLRDSLSPDACDFINKLKVIARPFECTTPTRRMGASRLTQKGKDFYKSVLEMLRGRKARSDHNKKGTHTRIDFGQSF